MWHSQRCHPEQHHPASSLLSPPLHPLILVRAVRAEEHLQRLSCPLCSLFCVSPRGQPSTLTSVFSPGLVSRRPLPARRAQRERVTHSSRSEPALFSLSIP